MKPRRLQIGASRLEKLSVKVLQVFLDKTWTHLGEETLSNPNNKPLQKVDYSKTNFIPFYFQKGDSLPFKDESFEHIFTEHFLEHLFLEDAIEILKECQRVLIPGGVMRIVAPDADLRPIPEILGFPGDHYSFNDPQKHKTRWSLYSLRPALEIAGLDTISIKHYDQKGILHDKTQSLPLKEHENCLDQEMLKEISHIQRYNSLIIDGVKNA